VSKSQKLLLIIHGSYGLATTMSGLFLNLYLWRISKDLSINATFILLTFFSGVISFWVGGLISKQKDRLVSYRVGIGLTALFYLLVVFLQERVASIPVIIGMINGTASGFYWLGFLVLLYDLVDAQSQSAFMGKQMAVFGLVNTFGPALAGLFISFFDLIGYSIVFIISFVLFLIGVLISLRLPVDPQQKRTLNIRLLWRLNRRNTSMRPMWFGWVIWGTCEGLLAFFPTLILFMAVDDELSVGIFSILLGVISILSSLWHSKYNHKDRGPYTILYLWIVYFVFCIPLIILTNLWSIILFLIVNEVSKNLIGVSYFSYMLRMIGTLPKRAGLRTESMILREIMLNIGRIFSILCFILLNHFSSRFPFYLLLFTILIQGFLFKLISMQGSKYSKTRKLKINHPNKHPKYQS
jgi:YQGE family putative transporter